MSYIINDASWRLEKRVPLAVVFALFLQVGAGLVWAAQLDVRVRGIEKDVERIVGKLDMMLEPRRI